MTITNSLDGLVVHPIPYEVGSGDYSRASTWLPFESTHPLSGSAFYVADPYFWDGVYPNAMFFQWSPQGSGTQSWGVTFWKDDDCSDGVFLRVTTNPSHVTTIFTKHRLVQNFTALVADYVEDFFSDGITKIQAGNIVAGVEQIVVERYLDINLGLVDRSLETSSTTSGFAYFAVTKQASGMVATIYGPRFYCAFSFACPQFAALPTLLSRSWVEPTGYEPSDTFASASSARTSLGQFTLTPPADSVVYLPCRAGLGMPLAKPHGPERSAVDVPYFAATGSVQPSQREIAELSCVGVYENAGSRSCFLSPAGFDYENIALTISPNGLFTGTASWSGVGGGTSAVSVAQFYFEEVYKTSRQLTTSVSPSSLGTRFFSPVQSFPCSLTGYAGQPDDLVVGEIDLTPALSFSSQAELLPKLPASSTSENLRSEAPASFSRASFQFGAVSVQTLIRAYIDSNQMVALTTPDIPQSVVRDLFVGGTVEWQATCSVKVTDTLFFGDPETRFVAGTAPCLVTMTVS
jgi:hypothetical protein